MLRNEKEIGKLRNLISHFVSDVVQSPKTAASVITATTGSGVATWIELIPNDIGKVASLVGICFTIILMVVHINKNRREREKHAIEIKILKKQLSD